MGIGKDKGVRVNNLPTSKQTWHVIPLAVAKASLVRGPKSKAILIAKRLAKDKRRDFIVMQSKTFIDYI